MPYTSDIPLSGSPLSSAYKTEINGMRHDITALNVFLPLLEQLATRYKQSTGTAATYAVMGTILASVEEDSYGIGAPPYIFQEYNPTGAPGSPASGYCWNVMEFGLVCDNTEKDFIPPGLSLDCLNDVLPGNGGPEYRCDRIATGTVVLLQDTGKLLAEGGKLYVFSCPVPMCVSCPDDDPPPP